MTLERTLVLHNQAIRHWDGKSTANLTEFYLENSETPDFVSNLVVLLSEPDLQRSASWLLKHHIDNGNTIPSDVAQTCYASLDKLTFWDAKLHILQSMHALPINPACKDAVYNFLQKNLVSERRLIRAWSYTGFVILASQHSQYSAEASRCLLQANDVETAGSIKVRIRKGLENLEL